MSVLLALVMLLTLIPTAGFAADEPASDELCIAVEEVELEGIGAVEYSEPLPYAASVFGLVDPAPTTYSAEYYKQQLDEDSAAVYDAILKSSLKDGPKVADIPIDSSKWSKEITQISVKVQYDGTAKSTVVDATDEQKAAITDIPAFGMAAILMDHPEMSWLVNTGIKTAWKYAGISLSAAESAQVEQATANGSTIELGTKTVTVSDVKLEFNQTCFDKATKNDKDMNGNLDYANTEDRTAIEHAVDAAVSSIGSLSGASTADKVEAIHDWICDNVEYSQKTGDPRFPDWRGYQTAYSALMSPNVTVCSGYAKSFKLLCDRYDVPCVIVSGKTGAGEAHAWNYVQVDGDWYAVDVTWGDQKSWITKKFFLKGSNSFINCSDSTEQHISGTVYGDCALIYPTLSVDDYPMHDHQWSDWNANDPEKHWKECTVVGCTARSEEANHNLTVTNEAAATEEQQGSKTETCSACGYTATKTIEKLNHDLSEKPESDGTQHWYVCKNDPCTAADNKVNIAPHESTGDWQTDKDNHWKVCDDCGAKLDDQAHTPSDKWALTADGHNQTCEHCGFVVAQEKHDAGTDAEWQSDKDNHWQVCIKQDDCPEKLDSAAHTWDEGVETTPATEEAAGLKTFTCTVCGATKSEDIDILPHEHVPTGDWQSDESGHWRGCKPGCSEKLLAETHSMDDGVETTPATEETEGDKTYTCTVCAWTRTEKTPVLEHKQHVADTSEWLMDEAAHWHKCTKADCDVVVDLGGHAWGEGVVTKPATEDEEGEQTLSCAVCGKTKIEKIKKLVHQAGTEWFSNDEMHWNQCMNPGCSHQMNEAKHILDEGTVTKEPTEEELGTKEFTCTVCGKQVTKTLSPLGHEHAWGSDWTSDDFEHWHECTAPDCGTAENRTDIAEHNWIWTVTKPATTQAAGLETGECDTCSKQTTREIPQLEKHEHAWDTNLSGNATHHWFECVAADCDIAADPDKESYGPHAWDNGEVTLQPTSTTAGTRTYKCTAETCPGTRTETIPALGITQPTHNHVWAGFWASDATHHWQMCTVPGCPAVAPSQMSGFGLHVWDNAADTTCNVCGATRLVNNASTGVQISFDANGGTASAAMMTTDSNGTLASLPTASRDGYTFTGWFTAAIGGEAVTTSTVFTAPATVYAQWQEASPVVLVPVQPVPVVPVLPAPPVDNNQGQQQPADPPAAEDPSSNDPAGTDPTDPAGTDPTDPDTPDDPDQTTGDNEPLRPAPDADLSFEVQHSDDPDVDGDILSGLPISGPDDADRTTVGKLIASIQLPKGSKAEVVNHSGLAANRGESVGTGYVVRVLDKNGNETGRMTVIVMGDVLGTGENSLSQLARLAQAYSGRVPLTGPYKQAALHTGNKDITLTDLVIQAAMYLKAFGSKAA